VHWILLVGFLWGFPLGFSSAIYVVARVRRVLSVWFRGNVPLLVSLSNGREKILRWSEWRPRRSRIVEIMWFALCLPSYAVTVGLTIRAEGRLWGETMVHYWVLVALVVGSIILLGWRSKGRSRLPQQK